VEQFTYVKRGYDPEEVDKYISTLEQVIKSYKEKDNAIKNAIISAQMAADNIIKNAEAQAAEYKVQLARELERAREEIERQHMRINAFQDVYSGLVRKYLTDIEENDMSNLHDRLNDIDKILGHLMNVDAPLPLHEESTDAPSTEDSPLPN